MQPSCLLGIDIGGTNFRLGLVDERGNLSHFMKKPSHVLTGGDSIALLAREISAYLDAHDAWDITEAVAIGFPSSLSADRTKLYVTPNLPGYNDLEVVGPLSSRLKLPVVMEKDVFFLLQNDINTLGLPDEGTVLGFYVGTGFGNAIYLNGQFYTGRNGVAGELGHIPFYGLKKPCNCGLIGCSEILSAGLALSAIHQTHFKDTPFERLFTLHGESAVLKKYVETLAIPIVIETKLLDPHVAVIAGGVIGMADFPREYLAHVIRQRLGSPYPGDTLDLRFPTHTQESGVRGAASYARKKLKQAGGK